LNELITKFGLNPLANRHIPSRITPKKSAFNDSISIVNMNELIVHIIIANSFRLKIKQHWL